MVLWSPDMQELEGMEGENTNRQEDSHICFEPDLLNFPGKLWTSQLLLGTFFFFFKTNHLFQSKIETNWFVLVRSF